MYYESIQPVAMNGLATRPVAPPQDQRMQRLPHHRQADPAAAADAKDRTAEIQKVLGEFNQATEPFNISLKFSRDEETGKIVIKMIDDKSGTTLHQFPEEAMLQVSAILGKLQGKIFDQRA